MAILACLRPAVSQNINGITVAVLEQQLKSDTARYGQIAERFLSGDNPLTNNDLALLYYGYALRPGYNPQQEDRILDAVNSLGRREKYEDALKLIDNFLGKHPACLAAWLERGYTAWLLEDSLQTVQSYQKYYALLDVPMKSGSGKSFSEAFVVSSLRDVELVLDKMGYVITGKSLLKQNEQHFQMVNCHKDGDRKAVAAFYFNVELPMQRGMQQSLQKKQGN